jgi:DNA polymerase-3 subunit beta
MRISCVQDQLSRGLAIVGRAVGSRTTMPILGNVLIATDGERLRLVATNLELGITTWVPARVLEDGTATVPARLLSEFVNSLPSGRTVLIDGGVRGAPLHLECDRIGANVKGVDPEEFPSVATGDDRPAVRIPAREFRSMIDQVAFCAARDESRPVLSGVNVRMEGTVLSLAAADGFRLAIRTAELDHGLPETLDVIIPARALTELGRLLGGDDDEVEVSVASNRTQVLFRVRTSVGETVLVSRLLDGQFPDLQRVVPKTASTEVTVARADLVTAIRVASIFARDSANVVRLELVPGSGDGLEPGSMEVSATAQEIGDNKSQVPAQVGGDDTHISFSSEFLGDVLGVLRTDKVRLKLSGPLSPAVIEGVGADHYTHVIMPMHSAR